MYCKCILFILIQLLRNAKMDSRNYSLYKITAFNAKERSILYWYHMIEDEIIFLNGVTNDAALPMDVILNNRYTNEFEKNLQKNDIEYYVFDSSHLNKEFKIMTNDNDKIDVYHERVNISKSFLRYSALSTWAKTMCRKYSVLQEIIIGKTFEQRDIFVLKLSTDSNAKKPAVFILGGVHGKDWMSSAIIINFIQMTVEIPLKFLTDLYDFYFLPVLNPDGYVFSMQRNKLWYKNRKTFFPKKICYHNASGIGVNLDRNFYFARTSSSNECDSVNVGRIALSEEESSSLAIFLNRIAFDMMIFVNLQSTDNLITTPFATPQLSSVNHAIVAEILEYSINRVNMRYHTNIKSDITHYTFYNLSGNIPDWVKRKFNTPIVFTHYITDEKKYFTNVQDIAPLTQQFSFIIDETLLLANKIYRPLFNKEVTLVGNHILLLFNCILLYIVIFP